MKLPALLALAASLLGGCATAGSTWMAEPLEPGVELDEDEAGTDPVGRDELLRADAPPAPLRAKEIVRIAPEETTSFGTSLPPGPHGQSGTTPSDGRLLGVFRNTYYDFPNERDYSGKSVELKNASCQTIREVPEGFYDALCVQGSGTLASGETASFAKRDCSCARVCPRTGQQICFDTLSRQDFPWGRGAQGTPITPLLTVAVDSKLIPLGTAIYIPEYDGVPRDEAGTAHDGCFIAQDRGMKVQGQHVDVFTGLAAMTKLWNRHVPSNGGVHVYVDTARCSRAAVNASALDL